MSDLKRKLIEKQRALGEADRAFSGRLGVSHVYWWEVRTTDAEPAQKICSAVIREFPELTDDVLAFMEENAPARRTEVGA